MTPERALSLGGKGRRTRSAWIGSARSSLDVFMSMTRCLHCGRRVGRFERRRAQRRARSASSPRIRRSPTTLSWSSGSRDTAPTSPVGSSIRPRSTLSGTNDRSENSGALGGSQTPQTGQPTLTVRECPSNRSRRPGCLAGPTCVARTRRWRTASRNPASHLRRAKVACPGARGSLAPTRVCRRRDRCSAAGRCRRTRSRRGWRDRAPCT